MPTSAEELLTALENRDDVSFAEISRVLQESRQNREQAVRDLMAMVCWNDLGRAESAINALRFSGLLLEEATYLELLRIGEQVFPQERLVELAAQERSRERERKAKAPPSVKLLKSLIMAILRHGGSPGLGFVRSVEASFQGTAVPVWIASLEHSPGGSER